jgi:hypothetical protein
MGLFKADLFRSLAAGFALGIGALFLALGTEDNGMAPDVVGHALAAPAAAR